MAVQFVQKDLGGTIHYEAPERWDASPVPTVILYGPSGSGELVASQNATLGPATTLFGAAAAGQTTVPVAATTGLAAGRQYTIGPNALGQTERVTLAGVTSTVSATTRDNLEFTYASADKFESTRLEATLSAAQATPSYRNCLARWAYTLDTQARKDTTVFHVTNWMPTLAVTEQDVLQRDARAVALIGDRTTLKDLIQTVWEQDVLSDMGDVCAPGAVVSGESLDRATVHRVLMDIYTAAQDYEAADIHAGHYNRILGQVKKQDPIDVDQSGTITDDDVVQPNMTGRLCRG